MSDHALNQAMQNVPPDVRNHIAKLALDSQKTVLAFPYYSTMRFNAAANGTASPNAVYTCASGGRKAFNYRIGDIPGAGAGFSTTFQATKSETNLLKASETRDNADVYIWGIALEIRPGSDAWLTKEIWRSGYLELALSGTDQYLLGPFGMFPSAGGLYGQDRTNLQSADKDSPVGPLVGHMNNGNPQSSNYFRLPQPILWQKNGAGKDTSLVMTGTIDTAIASNAGPGSVGLGVTRAAVAAGTANMTASAYTVPVDGTVFTDIRIRLMSVSVSDRSTNA